MSGATATIALAGAAVSAGATAYGAKKQNDQAKRAAKAASKPTESYSYRTPYMNPYISQIAPYILESAQQVYGNRMKGYGLPPLDFSKVQANINSYRDANPNYSGVGGPMDAGGQFGGGGAGRMSYVQPESFVRGRNAQGELQEFALPQSRAKARMMDFDAEAAVPRHEMLRDSMIGSRGNIQGWGANPKFDLPDRRFEPITAPSWAPDWLRNALKQNLVSSNPDLGGARIGVSRNRRDRS